MTCAPESETVSLYAIFADEAEALAIGTEMVERRLAACVNILGPCRSIYRWRDEVETATEVAAIFKTRRETADRLAAGIAERHSYDVPAIAVWPIAATAAACQAWVLENSDG